MMTTRRRTGLDKPLPAKEVAAEPPVPVRFLPETELAVFREDAWWAYEMEQEVVRFDTMNRKWTFSPEIKNDRAVMRFAIAKAGEGKEVFVSNAEYGRDGAREMSDKMVNELDEAISA